jgi:hypothetical protein
VMTRVTGSEGVVHNLSPAHASFVREQLEVKKSRLDCALWS